jgi:hypothetical protein
MSLRDLCNFWYQPKLKSPPSIKTESTRRKKELSDLIDTLKNETILVKVIYEKHEDWFCDEDGPPMISVSEVNGEILITCDAREVKRNPLVHDR